MDKVQFTPYVGESLPDGLSRPDVPQQQEIRLVERTPRPYVKQFDLSNYAPKQVEVPRSPEIPQQEIKLNVANANLDNLNAIATKLRDAGFTLEQQAAMLATVVAESGANPLAIGDKGKAKGLFQWHSPRFNAGSDLDSQIQLMINEIRDLKNQNAGTSTERYNKQQAYNVFNSGDLRDTISIMTTNFIRPANQAGEIERRHKIAQQIYDQLTQYVRRP